MKLKTLAIAGLLAGCAAKPTQSFMTADTSIFKDRNGELGLFGAKISHFVGDQTEVFFVEKSDIQYVAKLRDTESTRPLKETGEICRTVKRSLGRGGEEREICIERKDNHFTFRVNNEKFTSSPMDEIAGKYLKTWGEFNIGKMDIVIDRFREPLYATLYVYPEKENLPAFVGAHDGFLAAAISVQLSAFGIDANCRYGPVYIGVVDKSNNIAQR